MAPSLKDTLASAVSAALKRENPRLPGVFKVKIEEVQLDPRLFSQGRTVDIQARVRKVDREGRETTIWESKHYGENLAVAGKDDLTATWLNRPFEISWTAGEQVIVEVWDRRGGVLEPREFKMALPEPGEFPLSSGTHALEITQTQAVDARLGPQFHRSAMRTRAKFRRVPPRKTSRRGLSLSSRAKELPA